MATRGLYGFRRYGIDKITYNHNDSHPEQLGLTVLEFCAYTPIKEMEKIYDRIILVDENHIPTHDMIEQCMWANYVNTNVGKGCVTDWYCLLREAQGSLDRFKIDLKYDRPLYMLDYHEFIKDSTCCEYAYIINLDTLQLEFWLGFQKTASVGNRYGTRSDMLGWFPCKLVLEIPLQDIDDVDKFVTEMKELADSY